MRSCLWQRLLEFERNCRLIGRDGSHLVEDLLDDPCRFPSPGETLNRRTVLMITCRIRSVYVAFNVQRSTSTTNHQNTSRGTNLLNVMVHFMTEKYGQHIQSTKP
jgi:hypothetical protein